MIRTDEQIKRDIVDEFYWDPRIDASKLSITVEAGCVNLTGEVPTFGDLAVARSAVRGITGVREIRDVLTVAYASDAPRPDDPEMESSMRSLLSWDPAIDEGCIRLRVTGGVVTLDGTVDAHWKKIAAEDAISGMRGILSIQNRLAVVPSREVQDQEIAQDVVAALKRDALIPLGSVTVSVDDGVVTLTGQVPGWMAVDSATADASRTAGVRHVDNQLEIAA